jgi:hypothetical protein
LICLQKHPNGAFASRPYDQRKYTAPLNKILQPLKIASTWEKASIFSRDPYA